MRGRRIAVPFTIPGERVRATLDRSGSGTSATLTQLLTASPHRVTPTCRHFGPVADPAGITGGSPSAPATRGCGGCTWQHIAYDEQLRLKSALVTRLLKAALGRSIPVSPTLAGAPVDAPWGYRRKVHFVFGNEPGSSRRRGALVMGHYARGSRRIVAVDECPVHEPCANDVAFTFYDAFRRRGVAAAASADPMRDRSPQPGVLRSIALRAAAGTGELMTTLVVSDDGDRQLRNATRTVLDATGGTGALHLNIHPRGDAFIFGAQTRRLAGPERLREIVADTSFLISPTAFFQTNTYAAELLVDLTVGAIPDDDAVLDLYAGAGLFALPLARRGHHVIAVEENRSAVADGEASARLNRIAPGRCRFIAKPVESALPSIARADAVVLDPPRDGCSDTVIREVFGRIRPRRAVYISCNPEALARDLVSIVAHRYRITTVQPVDMFPHTAHVETVVLLTRA